MTLLANQIFFCLLVHMYRLSNEYDGQRPIPLHLAIYESRYISLCKKTFPHSMMTLSKMIAGLRAWYTGNNKGNYSKDYFVRINVIITKNNKMDWIVSWASVYVCLTGYFICKVTVIIGSFFLICAHLLIFITFFSFSERHNHKVNDGGLVTITNCLLFPLFKNSASSSYSSFLLWFHFPFILFLPVVLWFWGNIPKGVEPILWQGKNQLVFLH